MAGTRITRSQFLGKGVAIVAAWALPHLWLPCEVRAQVGGGGYVFHRSPYEDPKHGLTVTLISQEHDSIAFTGDALALLQRPDIPLVVLEGPQGRDYIGVSVPKGAEIRVEFSRRNHYGFSDAASFFVEHGLLQIYPVRRRGRTLPLVEYAGEFHGGGASGTLHFEYIHDRKTFRFQSAVSAIDVQRGARLSSAVFLVRKTKSGIEHEVTEGGARSFKR